MGPLSGLKIIEIGGLGAGPFCGMMMADMGADVVCVERSEPPAIDPARDITRRGKRSVILDLKDPSDRDRLMTMVERADALFEGFRPGVMEKLGLGPGDCLARNPRLVYGRMTGWGQHGPLAGAAGHDINYISLTGALHATGRSGDKPVPPIPMMGDFGGGAMFLAFGMVCALLETKKSGEGQVVDAAMTDGTATLMTTIHSLHAAGRWSAERGRNLLDSGAPFYEVYQTRDGKYISVGALEPHFYRQLIELAGLDPEVFSEQYDAANWPELKLRMAEIFLQKTRRQWCDLLEGTDACFAPVLDLQEAPGHPHNVARQTYIEIDGMTQPAPAPRFSRTPATVRSGGCPPGGDRESVFADWNLNDDS